MNIATKNQPYSRTLESLKSDLDRFNVLGADPKVAKQCNNAIDDVFFDIQLDQVKPGKRKKFLIKYKKSQSTLFY